MSKRKISARDFLIEQCLQDAQNEYTMNQLDEGWWDNLKAGARGAAEWLKQDAADSFKLRKKGEVQRNRANARTNGKIKSYANSLAQTMFDFKKNGGSLGTNIKNVDDVIDRLLKISKGKAIPQGNNSQNQQTVRKPQQTVHPQSNAQPLVPTPTEAQNQKVAAPQNSNNTQSSQNATITRKKSVSSTPGNATITNKGKGVTPLPTRKAAPQNINQSPNTSGQQAMLNSIDNPSTNNSSQSSETVEEQPITTSSQAAQGSQRTAKERLKNIKAIQKTKEKQEKEKAKRDAARKKRQDAINQRKTKEQAQQAISPQWEVKPNPINKTKPGKKPVLRKAAVSKESPIENSGTPQVQSKGKGTNVGDISNITMQQPLTTSMGDTIIGGYDANSYVEPKNKLSNQQHQLPAPTEKQQLQLANTPTEKATPNNPLGLPAPSEEINTKSSKKRSKKLLTQSAPAPKKLNVGKQPTKRKRILTAKNKLDNERQKEEMDKWVNSNPDMFMQDSYNPWSNTNSQIRMLNSIR